MRDAEFARDFRRTPCGTPLKSAPAPRSRKMSQSPLPLRACSPQTKAPVSLETTATSEDADTVVGHRFCEMLCEAFAYLPQEHGKSLKCGAAHPHPREPNSPLVRRDRGTACFPAWRTFPPRLRSTDEWSSKTLKRRNMEKGASGAH